MHPTALPRAKRARVFTLAVLRLLLGSVIALSGCGGARHSGRGQRLAWGPRWSGRRVVQRPL